MKLNRAWNSILLSTLTTAGLTLPSASFSQGQSLTEKDSKAVMCSLFNGHRDLLASESVLVHLCSDRLKVTDLTDDELLVLNKDISELSKAIAMKAGGHII